MNARQQKQALAKINKAMLLLQDVQEIVRGTDSERDGESFQENYKRESIWNDCCKAINDMHVANSRFEN